MDKVIRIEYTCMSCGAEDALKMWPNEQPPAMINCWQCHAGSGVPADKMLMTGEGMAPTAPTAEVTH